MSVVLLSVLWYINVEFSFLVKIEKSYVSLKPSNKLLQQKEKKSTIQEPDSDKRNGQNLHCLTAKMIFL